MPADYEFVLICPKMWDMMLTLPQRTHLLLIFFDMNQRHKSIWNWSLGIFQLVIFFEKNEGYFQGMKNFEYLWITFSCLKRNISKLKKYSTTCIKFLPQILYLYWFPQTLWLVQKVPYFEPIRDFGELFRQQLTDFKKSAQ